MEEYRRWEDNIKMDLKEIDVDVMNWMELAQDRDYCPCACMPYIR